MWWSATSIVVISLFTVSASLHTGRVHEDRVDKAEQR
jgi:hypothetical protein